MPTTKILLKILFPGIQATLDAMPDSGVILVFTDVGSARLELENSIAEKARRKNVRIFFGFVKCQMER